jgi:hypothetical protein
MKKSERSPLAKESPPALGGIAGAHVESVGVNPSTLITQQLVASPTGAKYPKVQAAAAKFMFLSHLSLDAIVGQTHKVRL